MRHVPVLTGLMLLLVLLPGGNGTALAGGLRPVSSSPTNPRTDPSTRVGTTAQVVANAEPTTTIDKFGTSFVTTDQLPAQRPAAAALAREAGVTWAREDIAWLHSETTQGTYFWSNLDTEIDTLVAQGIQPIGNIIYTPQFYSPNPGVANYYIWPPTTGPQLDAFSRFVTAAVTRYKDRVHYWQVWGTTEDSGSWGPFPGGLTEYLNLANRGYGAIKTADPTATIVMANSTGRFINQFLDAGGGAYVDVFAMSNYGLQDHPASPTSPIPEGSFITAWREPIIRDIVRRRAPSKPVWITEYDWAQVPAGRPAIPDDDQAAYLIRSLLLQETQANIGRVMWAFFSDNVLANTGMLVRHDLTKKSNFNAYKAMTTALAGASFTSQQPSPSTSTQLLENYEGAQAYQGGAFGSATGSFAVTTETAHSGTHSGKFTYSLSSSDFSGVIAQAVPVNAQPVQGSPSRFTVWAKGDGGPGVAVEFVFIDASNRSCIAIVSIVQSTDWRPYTIYLDTPNGASSLVTCGGADGIVINYPITLNGIAILGTSDTAPSTSGTVYVDDLTFESGPSIFDLVYNSPTNTTHAVWSLQGTPTYNLPTGATSVQVRDWQNNVSTVNAVGGVAPISASYHPVFVTEPSLAVLCADRPRVVISTARTGTGAIVATIRSSTSTTLLANQIQSIQVGAATNATINLGTRTGMTGNFTETFAAGTPSVPLTFRRTSGTGAAQVPLTVTDRCGTWRTFVGGGPSAF